MELKIVKTILNLLLSATILVSTIGIPVNRHFCLNRLTDVRLFEKAIPCAMEQAMSQQECPVPVKDHNSKPVKGCCHDTHELVKLTNLQNSIFHIELAKLFPVSSIAFVPYQRAYNADTHTSSVVLSHSPPLVEPDRTVKFHSFLI